jgi:hypothetical protein
MRIMLVGGWHDSVRGAMSYALGTDDFWAGELSEFVAENGLEPLEVAEIIDALPSPGAIHFVGGGAAAPFTLLRAP